MNFRFRWCFWIARRLPWWVHFYLLNPLSFLPLNWTFSFFIDWNYMCICVTKLLVFKKQSMNRNNKRCIESFMTVCFWVSSLKTNLYVSDQDWSVLIVEPLATHWPALHDADYTYRLLSPHSFIILFLSLNLFFALFALRPSSISQMPVFLFQSGRIFMTLL